MQKAIKKALLPLFTVLLLCGFGLEEAQPAARAYSAGPGVSQVRVLDVKADIRVLPSGTDSVEVAYTDSDGEPLYTVSEDGESLEIVRVYDPEVPVLSGPRTSLTVYIPAGRACAVLVYDHAGSVVLDAVALGSLSVETVSGDISLNAVSAQDVALTAGFGDISLTGVTADSIEASGTFTDISFERTTARSYDCDTGKGDISGTVIGAPEEYTIRTYAFLGADGLASYTVLGASEPADDGDKTMDMSTGFGNISLSFVQ